MLAMKVQQHFDKMFDGHKKEVAAQIDEKNQPIAAPDE